jgi:fructose-1,6-bisphosphatase/inositol monophosphatase family enzyme
VDDLVIPEEFCDLIEKTKMDIDALAQEIAPSDLYKEMTVFIDPIDGTREFSTNKGEQCSVCIGFADGNGIPQAGVVYRPITAPVTWACGAKSENYYESALNMAAEPNLKGLLTSNGSISKFIEELMKECEYERVPSGGAGNKMLMLLEGKGSAYIQDRGVSRWDTAGAQACIEAAGGILCKLSSFMDESSVGALQSYIYLSSETNLDFVPGLSNLTPYNAREKGMAPKKGEPAVLASDVMTVAPYSNLNGLLAIGPALYSEENMKAISDACQRAKGSQPPSFD